MKVFDDIRSKNIVDYGQKFEQWAPRILVDQYSDKTHFIYELLQNAEDAEATSVEIILEANMLTLKHDGRDFTEEDVRGICGVSASSKGKTLSRIGRFGIGFKSVYAYTQKPHIISGGFNFEIRNLIMPYAVSTQSTSVHTTIELPFDAEYAGSSPFSEIAIALRKYIVPDCMLTLSNIHKIKYTIGGSEVRTIEKRVRRLGKCIQDIELSERDRSNNCVKTKLIAFTSDEAKPVLIAYRVEASDQGKTIIPVTNPYLYAFFPTAIETHQSFYIHAPFDTTPARDNIRNNEYNRTLSESIATVFETSILWLRDNRYLSLKFFNQVYPIYAYERDNILFPLYQEGLNLIAANEAILPTIQPGVFCKLKEAFIPESQNITQCFDDTMLPLITGINNAHWLEKAIASETSRNFRDYLKVNFSIRTMGWKQLVTALTPNVLENKTDAWLISLLRNIQPYCYAEKNDDRINAKDLPLVRLQNGKHCCATNEKGRPQVYLNNPATSKLIIKPSILNDFFARNFYSRVLEIPTYDVFSEIATEILPEYVGAQLTVNHTQNIQHIRTILHALSINAQRTKELVSAAPFLASADGWAAPVNLYVPQTYFKKKSSEYILLEALNIKWLSEVYKGIFSPDELISLGCHASVETCDLDDPTYCQLLKQYDENKHADYVSKYLTKTYHSSRDDFHHRRSISCLPLVVDSFSFNVSVALAEYLAHNTSVYKLSGTVIAANDAALRGKATIELEQLPSAIGIVLLQSKWLYMSDKHTRVAPGDIKRSELAHEYELMASDLLDKLPFRQEDNVVNQIIGQYDPRYKEFLAELLSNSDTLSEAFNLYCARKSATPSKTAPPVTVPTDVSAHGSLESDAYTPDTPTFDRVVHDIVNRTSRRNAATIPAPSTLNRAEDADGNNETPDEDEYTKPAVDYSKKIEQAKAKSASEIDTIAKYEHLYQMALNAKRYSYGWFCALLELEASNSEESNQNSKEISISFERIELEEGTSRTLLLKHPSRNIPQFMEDLTDIPLVLNGDGFTKKVAIEVASVQSYSLRVKLKAGTELEGIDLAKINEARIDAKNPVFLVEALRKKYKELNFAPDYDMRANLPHNIEFVFGPPGTGKTTHLAKNVILPMLASPVRVLVLAPTNKAADVLTDRLIQFVSEKDSDLSWLVRFGVTNDERLEERGVLRDKTFDVRSLQKSVTITTIARFAYDYFMPKGERLYLSDLNWDYIIIDEASMIPLANIVYPLYKKTPRKFIIAGDPLQIEPIASVDLWKNESIYTLVKLDSFVNPKTVPIQYNVELLTTQYRSVPSVGRVFSHLAYGGILKHFRSESSQRELNLKDTFDIKSINIVKFPVSRYESIYRPKTLQHRSPYHSYSAVLAYEFVIYLANELAANNPGQHFRIGVIAPYRAQAGLVDKLIASATLPSSISVGVGTIHGFQGDECDIVLVLLNTPPSISASKEMFLNKRNIINVAISRARDYLFIFMPDGQTKGIENLCVVNDVEKIVSTSDDFKEIDSHSLERIIFGNAKYLEENMFSTSHHSVNVYGLPEKKYEIRSEEAAVDIQIHNFSS